MTDWKLRICGRCERRIHAIRNDRRSMYSVNTSIHTHIDTGTGKHDGHIHQLNANKKPFILVLLLRAMEQCVGVRLRDVEIADR